MAALIERLFQLRMASSVSFEDVNLRQQRIAALEALIAEIAEPAGADVGDTAECSAFEFPALGFSCGSVGALTPSS
jgi:hypothetical protein